MRVESSVGVGVGGLRVGRVVREGRVERVVGVVGVRDGRVVWVEEGRLEV